MHFQLKDLFQEGPVAFYKGRVLYLEDEKKTKKNLAVRLSWFVFSLIDSNTPLMSGTTLKYLSLNHANLCNRSLKTQY